MDSVDLQNVYYSVPIADRSNHQIYSHMPGRYVMFFATTELMMAMGFLVYPDKQVLTSTQRITYLCVIIHSVSRTVQLTEVRVAYILTMCS